MKALVLAGGSGTRLRPLTHTLAKQLVPLANKPVIGYAVDKIADAGIHDIGVVISPSTGNQIKSYLGGGDKWKVRITYILQECPGGLAHAVKTARPFLRDQPFLMFLGDNLIQDGVKQFVEQFFTNRPEAIILLKEVANPRAYGIATVDERMGVIRVEEKPQNPPGNLALAGIYIFSPDIHQAIAGIRPSRRGELEITDAIQGLLNMGKRVIARRLTGWWMDAGNKEDVLAANRLLINEMAGVRIAGEVNQNCAVSGQVQIGARTRIKRSTIRGPVVIGENCSITDSYIGPHTSIGSHCSIQHSRIRQSVIMDNCRIICPVVIMNSLIGPGAKIFKTGRRPPFFELFTGSDTELIL